MNTEPDSDSESAAAASLAGGVARAFKFVRQSTGTVPLAAALPRYY